MSRLSVCVAWLTVALLPPATHSLLTTGKLLKYGTVKVNLSTMMTPPLKLDHKLKLYSEKMDTFRIFTEGTIQLWKKQNGIANKLVIRPYEAPVDTGTGAVWYRQTTDSDDLNTLNAHIRATNFQNAKFKADWALVVTWDGVASKGADAAGKKKTNTFQTAVVADAKGKEAFVVFSYVELSWSTDFNKGGGHSSVSGEISAIAGFQLPNGEKYYMPGSLSSKVEKLARTSNTGTPGRWIYKVSAGIQSGTKGDIASSKCGHTCPHLLRCRGLRPGVCYCPLTHYVTGGSNKAECHERKSFGAKCDSTDQCDVDFTCRHSKCGCGFSQEYNKNTTTCHHSGSNALTGGVSTAVIVLLTMLTNQMYF